MIEAEHLKYFINEEIFLVKDGGKTAIETAQPTNTVAEEKETYQEKTHDIIVWTQKLTDQDQALLTKMLEAIKLDWKAIHHVEGTDFTDQYKVLLFFGHASLLTDKLNKEIPLNQPTLMDDKKILASYPLSELHGNVEKKAALWNGLKALFLS